MLAHNEKCSDCPYSALCLGDCRAARLLCHPGDILAPDESTCNIFRGGWLQKIVEKVRVLRPTAECYELKNLREKGLEANLSGLFDE